MVEDKDVRCTIRKKRFHNVPLEVLKKCNPLDPFWGCCREPPEIGFGGGTFGRICPAEVLDLRPYGRDGATRKETGIENL